LASQALYRKWRSQTFGELVGQEHVVQTLRNAIRTGRVGHAYLFTGPRGVGKTTVARLLAKAVNCEADVEERPCDRCEPCRAIAEGRAVDVIEMDAASHTGVDDAREIIERVQFRPTVFRTKVYVIDETHMLSTAAFNALLKTLEEPPAHVLFILATTEFHKVPATIVSRCQRFVFTRHSVRDIAHHLLEVAAAEKVSLEPAAADIIARAATGAMRDALSVLDQLIAATDSAVTVGDVQALLGAADSGDVLRLVNALADANLPAALRVITEVADNGTDMRQFARDLVDRVRGIMLLAAAGDGSTLDLPAETLDEMASLAQRVELNHLVHWLKLFSNLDHQLKNSPYGQLPLELAVVELLAVPQATVSAPAPAPTRTPAGGGRQERFVQLSAERPAPAPRKPLVVQESAPEEHPALPIEEPAQIAQPAETAQPEAAAATVVPIDGATPTQPPVGADAPVKIIEVVDNAAFPLEDVEAIWPQFVEDVRAESLLAYAQLDNVTPINVEEQTIVLLAGKGEWQKEKLESRRTLKLLENTFGKLLQTPVRVRVTMDTQEEMPDTRKQIQHARKDPLVRKAINIFEAEIVGLDTP
jgi:DNA polymerase III subunit gamma/tau